MNDRSAPTDLPILASIRNRWSPLAFSDQVVEIDKLKTCFEAARWAPSSYNDQPVAMTALGYLGDHDALPKNLQQRETVPRTRRRLDEIVYHGDWNESLKWE